MNKNVIELGESFKYFLGNIWGTAVNFPDEP